MVFGHVISGQEVVQTMENQKTDPNSRPYADVKVMNCGELIPKSKGLSASSNSSTAKTNTRFSEAMLLTDSLMFTAKKDEKKKAKESSSSSSSSSDSESSSQSSSDSEESVKESKKKKKKAKKLKKKLKKEKKRY